MRYFFLHPKSLYIYEIFQGRSYWEDDIDKASFIVVKEVGPAMEHYEEAMDSGTSGRKHLANMLRSLAHLNDFNSRTCEELKRAAELLSGDDHEKS